MHRFARPLAALIFAVCAVPALAACGNGLPGDALLDIDGTSVTRPTFEHWMTIAAHDDSSARGARIVLPQPPRYAACIAHLSATAPKPAKGQTAPTIKQLKAECAQQYASLQQEVLGYLITSQWVIGEASSLGVSVTDAEVKKQLASYRKTSLPTAADFERFLAQSGYTVSDLLLRFKVQMLAQRIQQKILAAKGTVTKAEILKTYTQNRSRYGAPERRTVAIVLTRTEAAAELAKAEIRSGKPFANVARRRSIDPTGKADGGLLEQTTKGANEKELDAAVFSAKAGRLDGPLRTPFGYYLYEVKSIKPASQQTLSEAESAIKQQLLATHQQEALTQFKQVFRKKWTAKTDCRAGFVVADCKQFKMPKASPSPGSPASG